MIPIDDQNGRIQLEFKITEVSNRFLRQLHLTTEAVTHIYHALINYAATDFPPLQTDSLPIVINDLTTELKSEQIKDRTLAWLFKKAFEEFIVGLMESLIEAHKYAKYYCLSNETRTERILTKEQIELKISEIQNRPLKLNFPTLINEIEADLGISLSCKAEVISINQVRNCLVHRNSVVSDKDVNDDIDDSLQLVFLELVTLVEKGGEIIELKWTHKEEGLITNKIGLHERQGCIKFKKGDVVKFDQNIFNGVSYTCIKFINNLLGALPMPFEQMHN